MKPKKFKHIKSRSRSWHKCKFYYNSWFFGWVWSWSWLDSNFKLQSWIRSRFWLRSWISSIVFPRLWRKE